MPRCLRVYLRLRVMRTRAHTPFLSLRNLFSLLDISSLSSNSPGILANYADRSCVFLGLLITTQGSKASVYSPVGAHARTRRKTKL